MSTALPDIAALFPAPQWANNLSPRGRLSMRLVLMREATEEFYARDAARLAEALRHVDALQKLVDGTVEL